MQTYNRNLPLNERIGGRYRIQAVLGEGGFGVTYRAWDERLERVVVLKEYLPIELGMRDTGTLRIVPHSQREADYRYGLGKYLDEAKALAKFNHPHIVQILDHLEANGTAYIVMKFEEGETLSERLKRGRLSEQEILALLPPLLDGLQQVHQAGLLHRDIKPGNIFLRKQGGPLLIDFGSARHALGEHSKSLSAIVSQGYAPPEQYSTKGKQGPYTDLYGLGAVLYELITGEAPVESVIRGHELMDGRPDPLIPALQAGKGKAPDGLLQLTDRLLAIPTGQRPQSCQEVLRDLKQHPPLDVSTIVLRPAAKRVAAVTDMKAPPQAEEQPPRSGAVIPPQPASPKTRLVSEEERFGGTSVVSGLRGKRFFKVVGAALLLAAAGAYLGDSVYWPWDAKEPIEPEMVNLEGGSFQMGSPSGEKDRDEDEKQHRVSVSDFYLAKYEVTFAQYDRFAAATGREKPSDRGWGRGNRPVINVSWNDATAYAEWLSKETGEKYRLPTEAEWEYACRAGGQDRYCGGNDLDALAWYDGNSGAKTHPVGGKRANAWGLYDMSGNVWEWTCSAYDQGYGGSEKQCESNNDANVARVLRGGSWDYKPRFVRSADRIRYGTSIRDSYLGFRLARIVSP